MHIIRKIQIIILHKVDCEQINILERLLKNNFRLFEIKTIHYNNIADCFNNYKVVLCDFVFLIYGNDTDENLFEIINFYKNRGAEIVLLISEKKNAIKAFKFKTLDVVLLPISLENISLTAAKIYETFLVKETLKSE